MAGQDRKKSKKGGKPKGEAGPVISTSYVNYFQSQSWKDSTLIVCHC